MSLTPALFAGFGIGALYATLLRYANVRIWAAPKKQKTVVITGSARGIGKVRSFPYRHNWGYVFVVNFLCHCICVTTLTL
jgi:hypothetical protein